MGKETGVIFIAVPIEWVMGGNTPGNRQQIANRVGPLLRQATCCRVGTHGGTSKPTGTVSILIQQLSEEGAVILGRGFLRLTGKDGISTRKGVVVHEKHSLTACNFHPKNDSSIILRGSHTHVHTALHNTPQLTEDVRDKGEGLMITQSDEGGRRRSRQEMGIEQLYAQEVVITRVESA